MSVEFPLRIIVMDDDYFALKGVASLLSRDLRTIVVEECESAESLLQTVKKIKRYPHIILIDAEYQRSPIPLPKLIQQLKIDCPDSLLVCWSQYGEQTAMRGVVDTGADGILIKDEVRLGVATSLVQAWYSGRAFSRSVPQILGDGFKEWLLGGQPLESWIPHPHLSPRLKQVFWLCIIYGMSTRDAAAEMHVQPETIERYRMKIYDIMSDGWADDQYLQEVWTRIQQDRERGVSHAYHLLTQPPRQ